jgi:hypothetical protein
VPALTRALFQIEQVEQEAGDGKAAREAMEQDLNYFARFLLNLLDLEQTAKRSERA